MSIETSVEALDGLRHRMSVTVAATHIDAEINKRLKRLAETVRMDGFRPGKVPVNVVSQKYGDQVRAEVHAEYTESGFRDAINKEGLRIMGRPVITPAESDAGLSFTATFDVFPEQEIQPLAGQTLERMTAEVEDADVDKVIARMRQQRQEWVTVDRDVAEGDQLFVRYSCASDADDEHQMTLVVGRSQLPEAVEQALVGSAAGSTVEQAADDETYTVEIVSVSEPRLPELDEAFVRSFDIDSGEVQVLRDEVRKNVAREVAQRAQARFNEMVLEKMVAGYSVDLPKALLDEEVDRLISARVQELTSRGNMAAAAQEQDRTEYETSARFNIVLGMLLTDLAQKEVIRVTPEQIRAEVDQVAGLYEDPNEVVQWYYADNQRLASIEFQLSQKAMVDWAATDATIVDKPLSVDALTGMMGDA